MRAPIMSAYEWVVLAGSRASDRQPARRRGKAETLLDLAQHQHAAVRRQPAAVEPDAQFLVLDG